ncbi:hypothetical protein B0H16DRAFT_1560144 [Mycena metata]|uniref:Uncharacterized protein n=1 Tax=Mycena metata TaxID=1033252 RepID=A0AAD7N3J7_9AGAR|nr:hypothetical protein B0H16DRAFT_1560144 [Mycena metata]
MNFTVATSVFEDNLTSLVWNIIKAGVELLFYGIYIVLFILAVYTLAGRKTRGKQVLLAYTWTMAILGTTQLILCLLGTAETVRVLVQQGTGSKSLSLRASLNNAQYLIFGFNNLLTDSLFLYRCFITWGCQWKAVVLPGSLVILTFAIGCIIIVVDPSDTTLIRIPFVVAAVTNLVLVTLTAYAVPFVK